MSIGYALAAGRARAEAIMRDACTVKRDTGDVTRDPVTLAELPVYATVYTGKCRVQRSGALSPRSTSPGGYEFGVDSVLAQLPIASIGIQRNDVFEVTEVAQETDPALLGLTATVQADLTKSQATKRTLVCEEVT